MVKNSSFTKIEVKPVNEIAQVPSTFATEETEEQVSQKRNSVSVVPSAPALISNDSGKTHQIKVVARFRPLNDIEKDIEKRGDGSLCVNFISEESVQVTNSCSVDSHFTLDRIFNFSTPQNQIYEQMASATINDVLNGYNGTIFAYGQSGSGKTYTMYGNDLFDEAKRGIIPRAISHIFDHIESPQNIDIKYELKFSMLEIYKENLYDLLNTETKSSDLKIKEHPKKGIYVAGLSEEYISSEEEFLLMIESADENRVTASTGLNATSSRSHLLFQLEIIQTFPDDTQKRGILNLVDLAGSEKVSKTQAMGQTLEEAKKINLSLSTLGNVIHALTSSNANDFVPYRDSKLTRILQDSLGGNYKTTLIVTCSPHLFNSEETITTLKFAQRAKKIKNKVKINIKRSVEQLEAIIEELSRQLKEANSEISRLKGLPIVKTDDSETSSDQMTDRMKLEGNSNLHPFSITAEALLQKKDEEIAQLNEKIEMLTKENKRMTDVIEKCKNMNCALGELERITKSNIMELNAYADKYREIVTENYKTENEILRESYKKLDEKYIQLKTDLETKLNNEDFVRTVEEFTFNIEDQQLNLQSLFSHDSESYGNIFRHSKAYMKYFLDNFLKKKDLFSERLNITYNLTSNDSTFTNKLQSDYSYLKTSFLKLSSLMVYYETLLFSFMNRTAVDIKKFEHIATINSKIEKKCANWAKVFSSYLEVLDEIQMFNALQNKEVNITDSHGAEIVTLPEIKLLRSMTGQASDDNDSSADEEQKKNEIIQETPSTLIKEKQQVHFAEEPEKISIPNSIAYLKMTGTSRKALRKQSNRNIIRGIVKRPTMFKNFGFVFSHILSRDNDSNDHPTNDTVNQTQEVTATFQHRFTRINNKKSTTGTLNKNDELSKFQALSDNLEQCRKLKKDIEMYRNTVEMLTMELDAFPAKSCINEAILTDFQEKQKEISANEFENAERVIKIYKTFYEEELLSKRHMIEELVKLVDEVNIKYKHNVIHITV